MATQAEAAEHRTAVDDIATLAVAELVTQWATLDLEAPERMRDVFTDLLADLVETYAAAAGAFGADWYEALRADSGVTGAFTAELPDLPDLEQLRGSASYAASGLYVDTEKALGDMAAIAQRLVADADRAAIAVNVDADEADPRWARVAQPGACAFCALLASRGPDYRTKDTATRTLSADRYHEHCGCVAMPVWNAEQFELPAYATPWVDAYDAARDALGPGADLSAVLSKMRETAGLR